MTLPAARVGGSLPATLEWLPRPPHDSLLAGHWDGTVSMWRLAPRAGAEPSRRAAVDTLADQLQIEHS